MRVFGSVYSRRRFYQAAGRRWRLLTALASALALVAGLLIGFGMHFPGWGPAPASDPGSPVAVHAVKSRKVYVPPIRPYHAPPTSWPAAQTAMVNVMSAPARAGGTPVYVGAAQAATPRTAAVLSPSGQQVRVSVASQQAAVALGVHGMVFAVTPVAGGAGGPVHVSVDYSKFAHAYGGDYASRLRLVELPACALTTPKAPGCYQERPLRAAASDNPRIQRVGADVTLPGSAVASAGSTVLLADTSSAGVVLAVSAAASGNGGNFNATPFSEASEWVNGASSGTFSYAYPVQVPPVPGGFAPDVSLKYSSQLTDGLTAATNPQASWVGDGWDYVPGYIESDYPLCSQNVPVIHAGDWCTSLPSNAGATPALTLSLNGNQSPIVNGSTGMRAEADSGATITSGPNGSMLVTQRDGTKLYFGLNQLTGWASGNAVTGSQWTLPAWNPKTSSYQTVAWRLMLDYEVDRHGNAIAFYYDQQSNWVGQNGSGTATGQYVRGGTLSKITYGFQDGHAYDQTPPGEVDFATTGGRQDAPTDLACTQNQACTVLGPTFWNDQQLTTISTKALSGTTQEPVDSWNLSQAFPATGDPLTSPSLWLSSVTRTGQDGAAPVTLPPTSFAPTASAMPNRVMTTADVTAGYSPMSRFRIGAITSPAGGVTTISYTPADPTCAAGTFPAPASNTTRCFPDWWLNGMSQVQDWWNVYAVTSKTITDTTGGDPPVVTSYTSAGPGWHYDNDTVSRSATQTFDGWRGFRTITTETGTAPDPVTETVDTYFQGLSKNCAASSCPTGTPVTLTSSRGTTADDNNGFAGMTFEQITYNGAGTGNEVADTIHNAGITATTETGTGLWAGVTANMVDDKGVITYTALAGGGARESESSYTYDTNGRLTSEADEPDVNDSAQWTCTSKTYGAFDLVIEQETHGYVPVSPSNPTKVCATLQSGATMTLAQAAAASVSAVTNTYDATGNLTQVQEGSAVLQATQVVSTNPCQSQNIHTGFCYQWQTTQTSTYDQYGRVLTQADADSRATTTAYTPTTGAEPTSVRVTDPMSLATTTTYDPARNLPLTVTDPAGYQTIKAYDALGRVTSAWTPGNPASGPAVSTDSYTDSNSAPSYVTEQSEKPNGGYLTTMTINDSLGQVRELQQQTAAGGSDVTDTTYNSDGWKALTSSPYYTSAAPSGTLVAAASASVPSQTGSVYDGDGRVIRQISYKNGSETWETDTTYGGNYTTVVPPAGGTTQTTFTDARGLTTAIYQYHGGVPADPSDPAADYDKTAYSYTAAKQLAGITDAAGNTWSYTYDLLGRKLTQSMPDSGTTTSTYDAAGQLMTVTDARGKTTSYVYDNDGRKTAEYDTTGGALESAADEIAAWIYDTLAAGKLTSSTSFVNGIPYAEQATGYNSQGLPSGTSVTVPSAQGALAGTYSQQFTYAPSGQETSYTDSAAGGLPAETVTTGYDTAGEPNSLVGTTPYVSGVSYTGLGQPLQYTMGSSSQPVYITDSWDPQTFRMSEQNTQVGTSQASIDDLHYSYDNFGNVLSEADSPSGAPGVADVQCFQNDYLGRLVQAWAQASGTCASSPSMSIEGGAAPYWNSYSYGTTSNLISVISTAPSGGETATTYTYPADGAAQPHATTSSKTIGQSGATSSTSYTYDAAGHVTGLAANGQNQTLVWNDAGQLMQAVMPTGSTAYIYDASGSLLLTQDTDTVTLYLNDEELSLNVGTGAVTGTRYYSIGKQIIAARADMTQLSYLIGNQQGSITVAVDSSTLNSTRRYYDPYGNMRGSAASSFPGGEKGFIGGTTDVATGLTNLGIREYQPVTASFISPDPVLKPYQPQDLNPYLYAYGNPCTQSDPSGASIQDGETDAEVHEDLVCMAITQHGGCQEAPRGTTEPPCEIGWCPEICGNDTACLTSYNWVQEAIKWGEEAGVDPKLILAIAMTEMSGRCPGDCPLNQLENHLAAALSFTPWYKASIGLANMKPDVWRELQEVYPKQFANIRWSSLVGNTDLDFKALAYYVKDLEKNWLKWVNPSLIHKYGKNGVVEAMYNLGITQFFTYVNPYANEQNPMGAEQSYLDAVSKYTGVAGPAVCAWSAYCDFTSIGPVT